jgi:uncharacterized surface protein with fasciclin (FAS1) repeats
MNDNNPRVDLADVLEREGTFTTFLAAAAAANMMGVLRGRGRYTLFAPTDRAFAKFPPSTLSKLMGESNRTLLISIIGYHLAPGAAMSRALAGKRFRAKTLDGRELRIDGRLDTIIVNGAGLVMPDLIASNGVLHGVDGVLWPKPMPQPAPAPSDA